MKVVYFISAIICLIGWPVIMEKERTKLINYAGLFMIVNAIITLGFLVFN